MIWATLVATSMFVGGELGGHGVMALNGVAGPQEQGPAPSLCDAVQEAETSEGMIHKVQRLSFSIGYAGVDAIDGTLDPRSSNSSKADGCQVQAAAMINKAGKVVMPTLISVGAALRAKGQELISSSVCPGLGFCSEIMDAPGETSWPITALTWVPSHAPIFLPFFPGS